MKLHADCMWCTCAGDAGWLTFSKSECTRLQDLERERRRRGEGGRGREREGEREKEQKERRKERGSGGERMITNHIIAGCA